MNLLTSKGPNLGISMGSYNAQPIKDFNFRKLSIVFLCPKMDCASFHIVFIGFFIFITSSYFLSKVIPKWKYIAKKCKGEDWRLDVKIPFGCDKIMIDLNDIKCALKGNDATNNIMNIFFCYILKGVPKIHGVHQCNNHEHIVGN
jgi:hypothetical protein